MDDYSKLGCGCWIVILIVGFFVYFIGSSQKEESLIVLHLTPQLSLPIHNHQTTLLLTQHQYNNQNRL